MNTDDAAALPISATQVQPSVRWLHVPLRRVKIALPSSSAVSAATRCRNTNGLLCSELMRAVMGFLSLEPMLGIAPVRRDANATRWRQPRRSVGRAVRPVAGLHALEQVCVQPARGE